MKFHEFHEISKIHQNQWFSSNFTILLIVTTSGDLDDTSPLDGYIHQNQWFPLKGTPWNIWLWPTYLDEISELSKILPDLEFSDNCTHEISRVLAETLSARRNICLKLKLSWEFGILTDILKEFPLHSERTVKIGVL